ncbi:MAG: 1-acyl-sn-glycerol-3-phosphate acyltransferase [Sandaracinaceae bacterium]|nr:1-acyl-sn-glycerol-3-phosphate acyltransferase [Sandaracinaceae bacterium]
MQIPAFLRADPPTSIDQGPDPKALSAFLEATRATTEFFFKPRVFGVSNVPKGGALVVANHNSVGVMPEIHVMAYSWFPVHGAEALPRTLVHGTSFRVGPVARFFTKLGAVPAAPEMASELLQSGYKVLAFPGGETDSMRSFRDRNRIIFGTRRGYIRLALKENVPIVPVVTAGGHETLIVLTSGEQIARVTGIDRVLGMKRWPITLCLPWGSRLVRPSCTCPCPRACTSRCSRPCASSAAAPRRPRTRTTWRSATSTCTA